MADFCVQCAKDAGNPRTDLAGLCDEGKTALVLCEGCGQTWVLADGTCIGGCKDCRHNGGWLSKDFLCGITEDPVCNYHLEQGLYGIGVRKEP